MKSISDVIAYFGGDVEDLGNLDRDAMRTAFDAQIDAYVSQNANVKEKITSALDKVFSNNPTLVSPVPALCATVMGQLWNGDPSTYGDLHDRVQKTIRTSPTLITNKGPSGGVRLRSSEELEFYQANGRDRTGEELKALREDAARTA